jgi:hypothetical protein
MAVRLVWLAGEVALYAPIDMAVGFGRCVKGAAV